MLENDNDDDDDDDIINPFNNVSEPDADTDIELDDQEEDTEEGWYKCCVGRWGTQLDILICMNYSL